MAISNEDNEKSALLRTLRERLGAELERGTKQALDAAAGATHEDNKPEGDKDMRSTEAAYIARGQAQRVGELEASLKKLAGMPLLTFAQGAKIQSSAIVDVADGKKRATYFIVPAGGGEKIGDVQTLATTSPLGRALLGLTEGDSAEVGSRFVEIVSVR